MTVTLTGLGCGTEYTVTAEALSAIEKADCIIGARRLLDGLPEGCTSNRISAVDPEKIAELLSEGGFENACVLYSGDSGFFSGASGLLPRLRQRGIEARVLPGISSVQYFAARLGRSWQDWLLCSAHGVECDPVAEVCNGRPAFFLTGGALGPAELCRSLTEAGLGELRVYVGENLSYRDETVRAGAAKEFAEKDFAPLSVMLAEAAPVFKRRAPGIPDELFVRGKTPMTKQEVRAAVLSKLAVGPDDVCWDIGAGTGSVSVELALHSKQVWAVEQDAEACELIRANREKFGAWKLRLVEGGAPEALKGLPVPDAVFIGGSGGRLEEILKAVHDAAPGARVCVSAIALETLNGAFAALNDLDYKTQAAQLSVSRTSQAGQLHLLLAQNPVFLITGEPL